MWCEGLACRVIDPFLISNFFLPSALITAFIKLIFVIFPKLLKISLPLKSKINVLETKMRHMLINFEEFASNYFKIKKEKAEITKRNPAPSGNKSEHSTGVKEKNEITKKTPTLTVIGITVTI